MTQVDDSRDAAVAALAGAQRTVVSHDQLVAIGCGRRVIAHWVSRGRLCAVFHGVYSVIDADLPPRPTAVTSGFAARAAPSSTAVYNSGRVER